MKKIYLCIILMIIFLCTGCTDHYTQYDTLPEKEVIKYVKQTIKEDYNMNVDVKLKSKRKLNICTFWLDNCITDVELKNTYTYDLVINTHEEPKLEITDCSFTDSYKINDKIVPRKLYVEPIKSIYKKYNLGSKINKYLEQDKNIKYFIDYNDKYRMNYYIYTNDYKSLEEIIIKIYDNPTLNYNKIIFNIIKDKEEFDKTKIKGRIINDKFISGEYNINAQLLQYNENTNPIYLKIANIGEYTSQLYEILP